MSAGESSRSGPSAATGGDEAAAHERLRRRYEDLRVRRERALFEYEGAAKRLEELSREARDEWGTDDVEALRARLAEMEAENERQRRAYAESLDRFERELAEVDKAWEDAE